MKKFAIIGILVFIGAQLVIVNSRSRRFRLENGNEISLWTSINGKRFLVASNHAGILSPEDNYIEIPGSHSPDADLKSITFYFVQTERNRVFYKSTVPILKLKTTDYEFVNIEEDSTHYYIIYPPGAKRHNDLNKDVSFIEIVFNDVFAVDNNGMRL